MTSTGTETLLSTDLIRAAHDGVETGISYLPGTGYLVTIGGEEPPASELVFDHDDVRGLVRIAGEFVREDEDVWAIALDDAQGQIARRPFAPGVNPAATRAAFDAADAVFTAPLPSLTHLVERAEQQRADAVRPDWQSLPCPRPACEGTPTGIHRDRDGRCGYCGGWSASWLIRHP